jgi:thiamine phosphate synthase YjbQ (UPF0047 family)
MHGIALATDRREQLVDVTESVAAAVLELGVTDGVVLLQSAAHDGSGDHQ